MKIISTRKAIFALLCLATVIQAFADGSFSENGFNYTIMKKDSSSLLLTSYEPVPGTDYAQPLHIPSSVTHEGKTYSVKRIETRAFMGITEIQSIVIDEGVENIGDYVFECCTNLRSIYIPASVRSIGTGLFGSCYNLTSIKVDEKNEYCDSRDGSNAIILSGFDELAVACSATKIPASVKKLGNFSFYHCNVMEQLVIPEGVETIGHDVFFECSGLKSISLPESLTEIGVNAFHGCTSLTSIYIPKNVTKIREENIFRGCNNLVSIVVDKSNPNYDSRSNCNGIVRKSDSALIAACRSTTIGNDISTVEDYCFEDIAIHSVNIPKNVTSLSARSFSGCCEIDEINVSEDNPNYSSPKGSNALLSKDGKTLVMGCRTTIIPESVDTIGDYAFWGRYSNLVLRIPENIKTIGWDAFGGCNFILEVILPKTLQYIGCFAFQDCFNLSVVQLSAPVSLNDCTFSNCYRLSTVSLPEGLKRIGREVFSNCKSLKHIHIPSSVTSIDKSAFENTPISEKMMKHIHIPL